MSLRLGLIGAGAWGKNYLKTVAGLKGLEITKVAGSKDDWKKVAGAKDLDGVIIATPDALHVPMASYAVERGLPVLVEKPLSRDPREALALLKLAKKKKGFVLVEHTYLFHPAFQALKNEVRVRGGVRALRTVGGNKGPYRKDTPPLWDYGAHDVAMACDLMGRAPESARADRQDGPKKAKGENLTLRLKFPGALAELNVGNAMKEKARRVEVFFADEALVFDDTVDGKLSRHALDGEGGLKKGTAIACAYEPPLTRAVKAFAEGILSDSRDLSSLELGAAVTAILADCEASLERP